MIAVRWVLIAPFLLAHGLDYQREARKRVAMLPLDSEEVHGRGSDSSAISNMVVGVLRDYTGRGPTKARTYIADNVITCVLGDSLTRGEQVLVANGHDQQVLTLRHTFQHTMRNDLVQGVEQVLDRKVIAFVSANHIDPDLAIETFVLQPLPDREGQPT